MTDGGATATGTAVGAAAGTTGPVVVTGAAGTVGSALVRGLLSLPDPPVLRLVDLPGAGLPEPTATLEIVAGDLQESGTADRALAGAGAVVHLAGQPSPAADWPDLAAGNLTLTASLLDAAARHGVTRLVLASSVHAAGDVPPGGWPVDPRDPAAPCCRYGVTKAAGELLARDHARAHPRTSVVALRLGLVATRPRWDDEALGWSPPDALVPWVLGALRTPPGYHCVHALASVDGPERYVTGPTVRLLGHERRVHPGEVAGLPSERPALAPDCRLWRHDGGGA